MVKLLFDDSRSVGGFTIVELLIVIVVIAILSAVSVVVYGGIRDRADDSAKESLSAQLKKKVAIHGVVAGTRLLSMSDIATESSILAAYEIPQLSYEIVYGDDIPDDPDKSKVYMDYQRYNDLSGHVAWAYWSNKDGLWVHHFEPTDEDYDSWTSKSSSINLWIPV